MPETRPSPSQIRARTSGAFFTDGRPRKTSVSTPPRAATKAPIHFFLHLIAKQTRQPRPARGVPPALVRASRGRSALVPDTPSNPESVGSPSAEPAAPSFALCVRGNTSRPGSRIARAGAHPPGPDVGVKPMLVSMLLCRLVPRRGLGAATQNAAEDHAALCRRGIQTGRVPPSNTRRRGRGSRSAGHLLGVVAPRKGQHRRDARPSCDGTRCQKHANLRAVWDVAAAGPE